MGTGVGTLRRAVVVRVAETWCDARIGESVTRARFAPQLPAPRVERISPGHLVALAHGADDDDIVVWRWYDAVVIADEADGAVRIWEPSHGEIVATARPSYRRRPPGTRAFASAGLPGAEWWVAAAVSSRPETAPVELDAVARLYSDNDLWDEALAGPQ